MDRYIDEYIIPAGEVATLGGNEEEGFDSESLYFDIPGDTHTHIHIDSAYRDAPRDST
jgi:hypothetical protein